MLLSCLKKCVLEIHSPVKLPTYLLFSVAYLSCVNIATAWVYPTFVHFETGIRIDLRDLPLVGLAYTKTNAYRSNTSNFFIQPSESAFSDV